MCSVCFSFGVWTWQNVTRWELGVGMLAVVAAPALALGVLTVYEYVEHVWMQAVLRRVLG